MLNTRYEQELAWIARQVRELPETGQKKLFWLCSQGLAGQYHQFVDKTGWGGRGLFNDVSTAIQHMLWHDKPIDHVQMLQWLELLELSLVDEDNEHVFHAHDALTCLYASVSIHLRGDLRSEYIGYALEPWMRTLCEDELGYPEPEEGDEWWYESVVDNDYLNECLFCLRQFIGHIEDATEDVQVKVLVEMATILDPMTMA